MNKELQDLAWSCLPKKFKEEVKLLYRIADSDIDRMIAVIMLENVFGLDNLTSNAKGEDDEMLYVSRKEVQKHYQSMKNQPSIKGNYQSGYQTAIYHLFGSKCLPDEVEHL